MFQKLFFARLKFACFYLCLLITVYVYLQTSVAKEEYFAFNTPRKTPAFRTPIDFKNSPEFDEVEVPNAPKQPRSYKSRLNRKNLADISVALFSSPKKGLFMETEEV